MGKTSIQWTDFSWNPIRAKSPTGRVAGHYCEKVSAGCAKCYASRMQPRFGLPQFPGPGTMAKGEAKVQPFLDEARLLEPLHWRKPRMVFVCDMSDLFGAWVPDEWIDRVMAVGALCPHLTLQILTKRIERAAAYLNAPHRRDHISGAMNDTKGRLPRWQSMDRARGNLHVSFWPLPNVWLGTSVEDQKNADERIPHLLRCQAAVRFLSVEPLLGAVYLTRVKYDRAHGTGLLNCLTGDRRGHVPNSPLGSSVGKVDWVIVGGESGPGARPCDVAWVRSIRDQCRAAGVACFVKQLGRSPYDSECEGEPFDGSCGHAKGAADSLHYLRLADPKGGEMEEWPEDLRVREFPAPAAATVEA